MVIFYDNFKKDLSLVAETQERRDLWLRVLKFVVKAAKLSKQNVHE